MRRAARGAVVLASTAAVLAGCGGQSEYCQTIRDTETQLRAIGTATSDADLEAASGAAGRIADVAPADVEQDWRRISTALGAFRDTLREAGITYEELLARRNLQDLTQQDRDRLQAALTQLQEANGSEVTGRIDEQVEDECDIVIRQAPSGS